MSEAVRRGTAVGTGTPLGAGPDRAGGETRGSRTRADHVLAMLLLLLGAGIAALALLGPLALRVIGYHVTDDVRNQVVGGDLVALVLVAPTCVVAALLVRRARVAGPVLALAPTAFAMYQSTQLAVGGEFTVAGGNSERAFPLMLAVFWLAAAGLVGAWRSIDPATLPEPGAALRRAAAAALVLVALFLVVGLHLPGLVDVLGGAPYDVAYTQGPTVFWLVKWMDLAVVVPLIAVTAIGALRRARWARLLLPAVVGWAALLGSAVAAMAIVMAVNDDPAASAGLAIGFAAFAGAFLLLAGQLVAPLIHQRAPA